MEQALDFGGEQRAELQKPTIFDVAAVESTNTLLYEFVKELISVNTDIVGLRRSLECT